MRNPIWKIATTHLLAKKRQTLVATLGVTFGIMIFIFQAGLITGFQAVFIEETVNSTANIHIFNEPDKDRPSIIQRMLGAEPERWIVVRNQKPKDELNKIRNGFQIIEALERHPDVSGVSPFLGAQAILRAGIVQYGGRLAGVDIEKEDINFRVSDYMIQGDVSRLKSTNNGIILGDGLADKLGVKMNDNLTVLTPNGNSLEMKVVGINHTGLTEVDKNRAYISIRNAQRLLEVDNSYITDINIKLKNIDKAEALAREFERKFGYKAEDWKTANASIFSVFKIQNMVTFLIIASILIVSGFGIFNILMMIIYEKMPDIAILKAIGYKDRDIRRLFLIESLVIGVIGGLMGLIMGFLLSRFVGSIRMDVKGFVSMEYLRFNDSPGFYVFAFIFALIATSLAGYFPARKASKVDPIDIIRSK
ncbi:MAG: ABC transporter permease [Bacteroidota bacterium]|jgi:lipoprotein-releasing system permease protein|nr:ABC transporter permease [Bacteroidia bacterium]